MIFWGLTFNQAKFLSAPPQVKVRPAGTPMTIMSIKLERRNDHRASLGSPWRLAQPEPAARRHEKKPDEFKYGPTG